MMIRNTPENRSVLDRMMQVFLNATDGPQIPKSLHVGSQVFADYYDAIYDNHLHYDMRYVDRESSLPSLLFQGIPAYYDESLSDNEIIADA